MKPSRFSTEAYPVDARAEAWRATLTKLGLRPSRGDIETLFVGSVTQLETPLGLEFATLTASAVDLLTAPRHGRSMWLMLLLDGRASIADPEGAIELEVGDIGCGPGNAVGQFAFEANFRMLWLNVPAAAMNSRLLSLAPQKAARISGHGTASTILTGLLRSVATSLGEVADEQVRPIESAVVEFLIATLLERSDCRPGQSGSHTAFLTRIYQAIESKLSEPDLSLGDIARHQGVSTRYLQRLLESGGETFSHYLRLRRLDHCHSDLANPLYDRLSVSEICFRWGFNDAAHFSRSFRDRYAMSPREFRAAAKCRPADLSGTPTRGRPAQADGAAPGSNGDDVAAMRSETILNLERWANCSAKRATPAFGHALGDRHHLPATAATVHWGYLSQRLAPVLEIRSGDEVTIETLSHHANDDRERMVAGDAGAEEVFHWTKDGKAVDRRGAGPADASIFGRGSGEGFGVHICTGPVAIADAQRGDVLEVRILDVSPRRSGNPLFAGRAFGSNAAAWWGYHYEDLLTEPKPREVVTVYEIECAAGCHHARALYNFRWTPQTDPFGVVHEKIDYPGVPVDHRTIEKKHGVLGGVRIPLRPHFGFVAVAPREADLVDSIPPGHFGGNLDDWRIGAGASVYLPVAVAGALFSVGDPHASQGDAELCGTAIECSLTGRFQFILHKKDTLAPAFRDVSYPIVETPIEWVVHGFSQPNYLAALGQDAQSEVYRRSSMDDAMRDAFRKARRFLMNAKGLSEDEAISLLSVGVDFGVTQVVNGNWGVHAVIRKELFLDRE